MDGVLAYGDPVEELRRTVQSGSTRNFLKNIREILRVCRSSEELKGAISILEELFFSNGEYYLTKYLFLLYDKLRCEHMARFYLSICYREISSQSEYDSDVNRYLSIVPKSISADYFVYNGDFTYVYEGREKKYGVHSFSNSIGYNLTLLITPYGSVILDCGAKCSGGERGYISREDVRSFLTAYGVKVSDIVGVLISHGHLDHWGSISTLVGIGIPITRFYVDERTKAIIKDSSGDIHIDGVRPVSFFFAPNQKIRVHSYDNGHILGSQLFVIRFDDKTVVYTGDFCTHDQQTVGGLDINGLLRDEFVSRGVDCLITESTRGNEVEEILPYQDAEAVLTELIDRLVGLGYKIFLPALAVGRSQELTMLLRRKHRLLIDGHSVKLTQTYERLLDRVIADRNVKYSDDSEDKADNFDFNDIVVANSGIISDKSVAMDYISEIFDSRHRVAVIRTGHNGSNEEIYGDGIYRKWKKQGGLLLDVPLSAHADYCELFELINALCPHNIVAIHGSGITHVTDEVAKDDSNIARFLSGEDLEINDHVILSCWKNLIFTVRERGVALDSPEFTDAFKYLVGSIKKSARYRFLLALMWRFEELDELWRFLSETWERIKGK